MPEQTITVYDQNDIEYEVEFEFSASYTPGRLSGPPEDCYPPDYEQDHNIISLSRLDEDGPVSLEIDKLDKETQQAINDKVEEWVSDNGLDQLQDEWDDAYADAHCDDDRDYDDYFDSCCGPYGYEG